MWLFPLSHMHTLFLVSPSLSLFFFPLPLIYLSYNLIFSHCLSLSLFYSFTNTFSFSLFPSVLMHAHTCSDRLSYPALLKNGPTQSVRKFISQHQFLMTFPNAPVSINMSRLFNETRIWIISPILSSSHILTALIQRDPTRVFPANPSIDVRKDLLVGLVSHCNKNIGFVNLKSEHKFNVMQIEKNYQRYNQ